MCDNPLLLKELDDGANNWISMDGIWFLAIEQAHRMDAAVGLDNQVWEQFSAIEAESIKQRLSLPECRGHETPRVTRKNGSTIFSKSRGSPPEPDTLLFAMKTCRLQAAREKRAAPVPLQTGRAG
jgi:hypothetical protein